MEIENNQQQKYLYVQQLEWNTFLKIVEKVNNVNKVYEYNMPNKATSYQQDMIGMIGILDSFLNGDEKWRVSKHGNVSFSIKDEKIYVGDWVIEKGHNIIAIPKINSFFIIPPDGSTNRGISDPTKVIQLINCISIMPMLLKMEDVKSEEKQGQFKISVGYEPINV